MGLFDVFRSAAGAIGDVAGGFFSGVGDVFGDVGGAVAGAAAPLIGGIRAGYQPGPVSEIQGPSRGGVGGFLESFGGLVGEAAEQFLSGGREPIDFPSPTAPRAPGAVVDPRRGAGDQTIATMRHSLGLIPGSGTLIDMPQVGFDQPFIGEGGAMATPVALPGGALVGGLLRQIPGILGGAAGGALVAGSGGIEQPYGGMIFNITPQGLRAKSMVEVVNPITGRKSWYRNVGRPILFSGDLRVCKRVDRVASRARRVRRGR